MTDPRAIGGVMPAAEAGAATDDSLWRLWTRDWPHASAFATARSALAAIVADRGARRLWLPAYACASLAEGGRASGAGVAFYAVDETLQADAAGLARSLAPGDAVLAIAYFGRPCDAGLAGLRGRFADTLWIEDRAQALDAAADFAAVAIFSPRKLVGVGDGGVAVSSAPLPRPSGPPAPDVWTPEDARRRDPDGEAPETWYPLFQAREAALGPNRSPASARTLAILRGLAAAPIAEARRANWRRLAAGLADYALWPDPGLAFTPLAFPIRVTDAAGVALALAARRVWAPRHWADLPSDPDEFPAAHRLAAQCLSLPCDQRYDEADMARIVDAVRACARPAQPR